MLANIKRRELMIALAGAATLPLGFARAADARVVGFLCSGSPVTDHLRIDSVRRGLKEAGYDEGRDLIFDYRWGEGQYGRLKTLAEDLARHSVAVIIAVGTTPAAVAAKAATSAIPIIFVVGTDPVKLGLAASLNRPGGNLTGVSFLNRTLVAKQIQILHEVVPNSAHCGFLVNPTNPAADSDVRDASAAADVLGLKLMVAKATNETMIETGLAALSQQGAGLMVVGGDLMFNDQRHRIVALAAQHMIPVLYPWREATAEGGLISYGADINDAFRQAGVYAGRILSGEKPTDLPVQEATKVELAVNLKTAKTLGLTFPLALLGRADEVIE